MAARASCGSWLRVGVACLALLALGANCGRAAPPSRFPDAEAALERMHGCYACSRGIQGEAKVVYFGDEGRVRGDLLYKAELPDRVRFDVVSPFGATLSTLTSDGQRFSLFDLRQKVFLRGAASACNLARFTQVPMPPHALVQLLRGEAPVLVHRKGSPTITWDRPWFGSGHYVITVPSRHGAVQTIHLAPHPNDWGRPWAKQRVWVLSVEVEQRGHELYRAELSGHRPSKTAPPLVDPDFPGVAQPPSGPACAADVPGRLRFEVPASDQYLVVNNRKVVHNPPLVSGSYEQPVPPGVTIRKARCSGP